MKKILLLGGSGMIGTALAQQLTENEEYGVCILTRNPNKWTNKAIKAYYWNIEEKEIFPEALENVYAIINLVGENVGSKPWTQKRKKAILESRIKPLELLLSKLSEKNIVPKIFISSSATGYYGLKKREEIMIETASKGEDFLANVCEQWEKKAIELEKIGTRVVIIRTPVVLAIQGGVLKKMLPLALLGLNGIMGSGKQPFPWIHIKDICKLFVFMLENTNARGIYNGTASEYTDNENFTKILAKTIGYKIFMPRIPEWFLRFIFGEMAILVLEGNNISNQKIKSLGFTCEFDTLEVALEELLEEK